MSEVKKITENSAVSTQRLKTRGFEVASFVLQTTVSTTNKINGNESGSKVYDGNESGTVKLNPN